MQRKRCKYSLNEAVWQKGQSFDLPPKYGVSLLGAIFGHVGGQILVSHAGTSIFRLAPHSIPKMDPEKQMFLLIKAGA